MAQLPGGQILVQEIGGDLVIFDRDTESEYHRFNIGDANATAIAQGHIWHDESLTEEQRCFAIFWSGFFHAAHGVKEVF